MTYFFVREINDKPHPDGIAGSKEYLSEQHF
jgi:hypothetical protein